MAKIFSIIICQLVALDDVSISEILVGSLKSKQDEQMSKMLYDPDVRRKLNFVDIISAEFVHAIKILGNYTGMASVLRNLQTCSGYWCK